jgi:hypothetical protein
MIPARVFLCGGRHHEFGFFATIEAENIWGGNVLASYEAEGFLSCGTQIL